MFKITFIREQLPTSSKYESPIVRDPLSLDGNKYHDGFDLRGDYTEKIPGGRLHVDAEGELVTHYSLLKLVESMARFEFVLNCDMINCMFLVDYSALNTRNSILIRYPMNSNIF